MSNDTLTQPEPAGSLTHRPFKILLGSDGSRYAQRAADFVARVLPEDHEIRVIVVGSLELAPYTVEWQPRQLADASERRARFDAICDAAFGPALARLEAAGARIERVRRLGNPAEMIMEEICRWRPDLVVVGRAGAGGFNRLLLGSVSGHLARHARVPIMIVP